MFLDARETLLRVQIPDEHILPDPSLAPTQSSLQFVVVYYESRKRELKIRLINERNCCLLLIDKARAKDKTYI